MNDKPDGLISKIKIFIQQDLWDLEPESLTKARASGLKFLRVCMLVIKGFKEDDCPLHASALTFISVMALVPFLAIIFAFAKGFGVNKASEMLIKKAADMPDALQEALTKVVETVESASAGAMGSIGFVLFLWIAIKMISNIEETFNIVWGVKVPRTMIDKIRNYIVIIVAAPILLIISNAGMPILMGFTEKLEWMGPILKFGLQLIPVFMMALAFSVVYILLPNTKVKFSSAIIGGLVAALLSVIFQYAMVNLGVGVSKYNKIYGTLAAIPMFLFWIQTSWMILLIGAEVAFSSQNAGTYAREQLAVKPSTRARLCLAVALMKRITEKFESPETPFNAIAYGTENRIPVRLINDVINTLAQAGLISESVEHPGCYTLLRDPLNITARDITDSVLDDGAAPAALGLASDFTMFGKITNDSFQTLEKQILKSF